MGRSYRGRGEEDDFDALGGGKPKAKHARGAETGTGGVYELEVVLEGSDPPVRRRILVDADTPLDRLHRILQIAMGWQDNHLHQFIGRDELKYSDAEFELEWAEDESHYDLRDLAENAGDTFRYEYDFGDNWAHTVRVERILAVNEAGEFPACVDGERACPPEECGGLAGYRKLLGKGAFDADALDVEAINRQLSELT